jgi:hypothetical protein
MLGVQNVDKVLLGSDWGLILNIELGVSAWGTRCSQLGIGACPPHAGAAAEGVPGPRERPFKRFDVQSVAEHVKLVTVPVPVRLPRESVAEIAIGRLHCVALLARGDVFEWGQRYLVQEMDAVEQQIANLLERQEETGQAIGDVAGVEIDCGRVHLATPMRIDLDGTVLALKAAGDVTAVMGEGAPPSAWAFAETMAKFRDRLRPALMSFRWLQKATRLDLASSDSVFAVIGHNPSWKPQPIAKLEPVLQPLALSPKRVRPVLLPELPDSPKRGLPSRSPTRPSISPNRSGHKSSPPDRSSPPESPGTRLSPPASPGKSPPGSPGASRRDARTGKVQVRGDGFFPAPRIHAADLSNQQFRMQFQSPTYSEVRPEFGTSSRELMRAKHVMPQDVTTNRFGLAAPVPPETKEMTQAEKERMLVEIQRELRKKKLSDLDDIAKMLRGD